MALYILMGRIAHWAELADWRVSNWNLLDLKFRSLKALLEITFQPLTLLLLI